MECVRQNSWCCFGALRSRLSAHFFTFAGPKLQSLWGCKTLAIRLLPHYSGAICGIVGIRTHQVKCVCFGSCFRVSKVTFCDSSEVFPQCCSAVTGACSSLRSVLPSQVSVSGLEALRQQKRLRLTSCNKSARRFEADLNTSNPLGTRGVTPARCSAFVGGAMMTLHPGLWSQFLFVCFVHVGVDGRAGAAWWCRPSCWDMRLCRGRSTPQHHSLGVGMIDVQQSKSLDASKRTRRFSAVCRHPTWLTKSA